MKKHPIKKKDAELTKTTRDNLDINKPSYIQNPFFSFKHSYQSISSFGSRSHIKIKEQRYENGKFENEEFECTTDVIVYKDMISEMQKFYLNQLSNLLKLWSSSFLPLIVAEKFSC